MNFEIISQPFLQQLLLLLSRSPTEKPRWFGDQPPKLPQSRGQLRGISLAVGKIYQINLKRGKNVAKIWPFFSKSPHIKFQCSIMSSPKIRLFISLSSPQSWIPHPSALQYRHPLDQRIRRQSSDKNYGSLTKKPVTFRKRSHWSDLLLEASMLETSNLHTKKQNIYVAVLQIFWSSMPSLGSYIIANLRGDKPNLPTCHTQAGTSRFGRQFCSNQQCHWRCNSTFKPLEFKRSNRLNTQSKSVGTKW